MRIWRRSQCKINIIVETADRIDSMFKISLATCVAANVTFTNQIFVQEKHILSMSFDVNEPPACDDYVLFDKIIF